MCKREVLRLTQVFGQCYSILAMKKEKNCKLNDDFGNEGVLVYQGWCSGSPFASHLGSLVHFLDSATHVSRVCCL